MDEVLRIVSEHPEYPEPCPMLHKVAAKAASQMNKEWVIHMVREACRQTKEAIISDLKQSLPNETRMTSPIPKIRAAVERMIGTTNIPLSAARVRVAAIEEVLEILDGIESSETNNKENQP
jgi:hypothetical protein